MLERGQKLDDLVQKTDKLSGTSKAFYKEVLCGVTCVASWISILLSLIPCRPEEGRVVLFSDLLIIILFAFLPIITLSTQ